MDYPNTGLEVLVQHAFENEAGATPAIPEWVLRLYAGDYVNVTQDVGGDAPKTLIRLRPAARCLHERHQKILTLL